jgi:hypothetical protein
VRVLPTVLNTVTAATEISAAIKAYSIEVAAVSLLRRLAAGRREHWDGVRVSYDPELIE